MSKSKHKKKSSQMILRVEKQEKDQFQDICKGLDTSAARELRRFMREFVAANSPAPQAKAEAETVAAVAEPLAAAPLSAEPATAEPATAEPATEKPVTEKPVTEKPVTEETVAEEAVVGPDAKTAAKKKSKKK